MADLIEFIGLSYFVISCAQSSCISTFNPPFIYQNIEYHHFYACRNEIDEIHLVIGLEYLLDQDLNIYQDLLGDELYLLG